MINQPSNQIKLTNVAIVRLKKGKKRFEVACYKNSVASYRAGSETNLSEILQIENVFINVSKGQVAKKDELEKAFGTTDIGAIVREILDKGESQVGDKERKHEIENLRREIATQISDRCVDPGTGRMHTVSMIEKGLSEIKFSVDTNKSAKSQALEAIKRLQEESSIPLQRARMRVRVTLPTREGKRLREQIVALAESVEEDECTAEEWELIALIDPSDFKRINDLLHREARGGQLETLSTAVMATSEQHL